MSLAPGTESVDPHPQLKEKQEPMTFGSRFTRATLRSSPRYRTLARLESYGECTQHHHKLVDWEGNLRPPGPPTSVPPLGATPAPFWTSMSQRYPRASIPLGKLLVRTLSACLFGDERCPKLVFVGDDDATDYAGALADASDLWTKFFLARNWGGGCGTVGISWCFHDGKPRIEIHRAKHLWVHEWVDRSELIPARISEVYTYPVEEWNDAKRRLEVNFYWYHRYWDREKDILFEPYPTQVDGKEIEPQWIPDEVNVHEDGDAHFVWIQNSPSDEIDGLPDYDGVTDDLDDLDVVYSVLSRGTSLNMDPTLVIANDPAKSQLSRGEVRKGSDNALNVGEGGDAKYLEIAGTSVDAGIKLLEKKIRTICDVAQVVLTDPNEIAASGISSVAIKLVFAPMLAQANVLRSTYGKKGICRLVLSMMRVARKNQDRDVVRLPPRIEQEKNDETGEDEEKTIERTPGESEDIDLHWPPYFQATPADKSQEVTTLTTAVGAGKQVLSTRTANEEAAKLFGRDPAEEWQRLQEEQDSEHEKAAGAFADADAGGRSTELTKSLPGEGELKISSTGESDKPKMPPAPAGTPGGASGVPGSPGGLPPSLKPPKAKPPQLPLPLGGGGLPLAKPPKK